MPKDDHRVFLIFSVNIRIARLTEWRFQKRQTLSHLSLKAVSELYHLITLYDTNKRWVDCDEAGWVPKPGWTLLKRESRRSRELNHSSSAVRPLPSDTRITVLGLLSWTQALANIYLGCFELALRYLLVRFLRLPEGTVCHESCTEVLSVPLRRAVCSVTVSCVCVAS